MTVVWIAYQHTEFVLFALKHILMKKSLFLCSGAVVLFAYIGVASLERNVNNIFLVEHSTVGKKRN